MDSNDFSRRASLPGSPLRSDLDNLIRRRIIRHLHHPVAVFIREHQPGIAQMIPQGVLFAPGRGVARIHVEVEVAPLLVVNRLDAERTRRRGLAVLDAAGVILLVLHRGACLHDLAQLVARGIVHDLDRIACAERDQLRQI